MNIFQEFEERKIDYKKDSTFYYFPHENIFKKDIAIIIPVNGRLQFNNIISDAFERAIKNSGLTIRLCFVEHSDTCEHRAIKRDWVSNIWIPRNGNRFNKCLCFNIGVIYHPNANYYLFHDSDILVPENFFELLMRNIEGYDAVQTFSGQRLFHCSRELTENILRGRYPINRLSTSTNGVMPARAGAEGGSIFIKKEMIEKGCIPPDWACSEYSVEDSFLFRFLQLMGNVGFCNEPPIDCFHLWHEPSYNRQTKKEDWDRYYAFMAMEEDGKKHLIQMQADHFKKYFND